MSTNQTMGPIPPEDPPQPISLSEFDMMVKVRAMALDLAIKMPNARLPSTIFKKAEEIEAWLTRKP